MFNTPILNALLTAGTITLKDGEYLGVADDGVSVLIGSQGLEHLAERYLTVHPTPAHW